MKKHAALLAGCVLGLGCIILGSWREIRHQEQSRRWLAEKASLRESESALRGSCDKLAAELEASEQLCSEMGVEVDSLRDRATNLTAQRDHLRAENERLATQAKESGEALGKSRRALAAARHELLQMAAEPHRLEAEVNRRQSRIEELESVLDKQVGLDALQPTLHAVEGISRDGSVMSLSGPPDKAMIFPCPVQVCRRNEILLDGWINRLEGGILIAHIEDWRVPASALVKGEKVFILRVNYHDPDP